MSTAINEVVAGEVFMHVWPVSMPSNGTQRFSAHEVELIGSHTADPSHLDPSCNACHDLRGQLERVARAAVDRVAPSPDDGVDFDIYYDPGSIVCSPNGLRPCVTVSIYVSSYADTGRSSNASDAVSQIKHVLSEFGIRER